MTETISKQTITEAVLNGVEWLNEELPDVEWWWEIDLLSLEMGSDHDCILAQLSTLLLGEEFEYSDVSKNYLGLDPIECGFEVKGYENYYLLQDEWVEMINNLRALSGTDLHVATSPTTMVPNTTGESNACNNNAINFYHPNRNAKPIKENT